MIRARKYCRRGLLAGVAAWMLIGPVSGALAQSDEQDRARDALRRGQILSYAEISRRARAQFGGRVVGQSLREQGRSWVYQLRILRNDGTVISVRMDARSGRVLGTRGQR